MKKFTSAMVFASFVGFIVVYFIMHLSVTSYAATCTPYKNGNGCHMRVNGVTIAYLKDTSKTGNLSKNDVIKPYSALSSQQQNNAPVKQSTTVQSTTVQDDDDTHMSHCKNSDVDCNQDKREKHAPVKPVVVVQNTTNVTNVQNTYNTVQSTTYEDYEDYGDRCIVHDPYGDSRSFVVMCNGDVLIYIDGYWHTIRYHG